MYSACQLLKDAFTIQLFCIYLKDNTYMYMFWHSDICKCHMLPKLQAASFMIIQYNVISMYPRSRKYKLR